MCVFNRMLQRTQSAHHGTPGHFAGCSCLHRNHKRLLQGCGPQQVSPRSRFVQYKDQCTWWIVALTKSRNKHREYSFYFVMSCKMEILLQTNRMIISRQLLLDFALQFCCRDSGSSCFCSAWSLLSLCDRCVVKITGEMVLSFPAGITRHFSSHPTQPVLTFSISNYNRLEQVLPNPQLLCW